MTNAIICADMFDFLKTVPDGAVDLFFADLPYGTTKAHWDTVPPLDRLWAEIKRVLKPKRAAVFTASQPFTTDLIASQRALFRYEWVWVKSNPTGWLDAPLKPLKVHESVLVFSDGIATNGNHTEGRMIYNPQMEAGEPYTKDRTGYQNPEIYGSGDRGNTINTGDRYPKSVLFIPNSNGRDNRGRHPTQKPVKLLEYLIKTYSNPGDLVLDPCVGSGTTAVAARNLDRQYLCCDSNQAYVTEAQQRLIDSDPYQDRKIGNATQTSLFSLLT